MQKIFPITLVIILLQSCSTAINKQRLVENFVDMRTVPSEIVSVENIGGYDIAYQDESDISAGYNYPNNYAIGKINRSKSDYDYVVYVVGISPIEEFKYVTSILEYFESDSTYVDVLIRENDLLKANIYRATKEDVLKSNFMMWKWVKTPYGKMEFTTIKIMNQRRFKE